MNFFLHNLIESDLFLNIFFLIDESMRIDDDDDDDNDFCEDLIANVGTGNYFLVINFDIFF